MSKFRKEDKMNNIKFISYDGRYPNLCRGVLILEYKNKEYSFEYLLESGGSVSFDSDWNA